VEDKMNSIKQESCDFAMYKGYPVPTMPDIKRCVVNLQANSAYSSYNTTVSDRTITHRNTKSYRGGTWCNRCTTDNIRQVDTANLRTSSSESKEVLNEDCVKGQTENFNKMADRYNHAANLHDVKEQKRCDAKLEKYKLRIKNAQSSRQVEMDKLKDVDSHYKQEIMQLSKLHFDNSGKKCEAKRFRFEMLQKMRMDDIDALKNSLKLHDKHASDTLVSLRAATIEKEQKQCESVKRRWDATFKNIEDKRARHLLAMEEFKNQTASMIKGREQNTIKQIISDWKELKTEMKEERENIKKLSADLVQNELDEMESIKQKEEYQISLSDLTFGARASAATFTRTKMALNMVHNAMQQVHVAIQSLIVMFEEYGIKLRYQQDKIELLSDDLKNVESSPELKSDKKLLVSHYFNTVRALYEDALGWAVFSKMGYTSTRQLNKLPVYSATSDIKSLHAIFKKVTKQNIDDINFNIKNTECKQRTVNLFQPASQRPRQRRSDTLEKILNDPACSQLY